MPLKNELTLAAFIAKFSSEKACHEYLAKNVGQTALYVHPAKERTVGCSRMENTNAVIATSRSA